MIVINLILVRTITMLVALVRHVFHCTHTHTHTHTHTQTHTHTRARARANTHNIIIIVVVYSSLLYIAILCSRADSPRSCRMWFSMTNCILFWRVFLISTEVVYIQCCLVVTWLVPRETAAVSARSVYTIQLCTMSPTSLHAKPHTYGACVFNWREDTVTNLINAKPVEQTV